MTITEGRPMTYIAADGARIELAVAGPATSQTSVRAIPVSGERLLTTQNEEYARTTARNEAETHNARGVSAPTQVESPLPVAERCASGLAAGATLTMPTGSQARKLHAAQVSHAKVLIRSKACTLLELRAMARRGWLELDDPIRPRLGTLTDSGRRALERYEAKHGTPAGAR